MLFTISSPGAENNWVFGNELILLVKMQHKLKAKHSGSSQELLSQCSGLSHKGGEKEVHHNR